MSIASHPLQIETLKFIDDGITPNNPKLPLVLMRETDAEGAMDPADWFETTFADHGWGAAWRWTVYLYQHFHSTNHEVLGVSRGWAKLLLGGQFGLAVHVRVGDVIIIPAGTGHRRIASSENFQVVGAYPRGEKPDLIRSCESYVAATRQRIAKVPMPSQDPIFGKGGPLFDCWRRLR